MKLVGYIQGVEVVFDFWPPDKFKCTIPNTVNGRYILQLKAIDAAGNQTNVCDVYLYIDFKAMDFVILDENLVFNIDGLDLGYRKLNSPFEITKLNRVLATGR